jgi:hypothetical protein
MAQKRRKPNRMLATKQEAKAVVATLQMFGARMPEQAYNRIFLFLKAAIGRLPNEESVIADRNRRHRKRSEGAE